MGINKQILLKIDEKTQSDKNVKNFLVKLLLQENVGIGQYKKFYKDCIDEFVKEEGNNDEN